MRSKALLVIGLLFVCMPHAVALTVEHDFNLYGTVPNTPAGICAAAATINSFVYLYKAHNDVYGTTRLLDRNGDGVVSSQEQLESRDLLAYGWDYGTAHRPGIYQGGPDPGHPRDWWTAKVQWILDWAPYTTVFGAQVYNEPDANNWIKGDVIEKKYPTWNWLWTELSHCEDIELNIYNVAYTAGHAITLTSMHDTDGIYQIDYSDPNDPTDKKWTTDLSFNFDEGGRMEFTRNGEKWYVSAAFAESVPEPATIIILSSSLMGLVAFRRRRLSA